MNELLERARECCKCVCGPSGLVRCARCREVTAKIIRDEVPAFLKGDKFVNKLTDDILAALSPPAGSVDAVAGERSMDAKPDNTDAAATLSRLQSEVEALRAAANEYLDNDGSRGNFHALRLYDARTKLISALAGERSCTCHPDERPQQCQHKYALSDCWAAAEPDESWRRSTALWGVP